MKGSISALAVLFLVAAACAGDDSSPPESTELPTSVAVTGTTESATTVTQSTVAETTVPPTEAPSTTLGSIEAADVYQLAAKDLNEVIASTELARGADGVMAWADFVAQCQTLVPAFEQFVTTLDAYQWPVEVQDEADAVIEHARTRLEAFGRCAKLDPSDQAALAAVDAELQAAEPTRASAVRHIREALGLPRLELTPEALAASLPNISGYAYGDMKPTSVWALPDVDADVSSQVDDASQADDSSGDFQAVDVVPLSDLATTATRTVYLPGGNPELGLGWLAEVSIFDAGDDTPQLWEDFVDQHRIYALVGPGAEGVYVSNTVPATWQQIGNEIVMTGVTEPDGDIGAAWFHDGLIWAVSGWSSSTDYVEDLIAAQVATGAEPEQIDIDALEGVLVNVPFNVKGFKFVDAQRADVLAALEGVGNCIQHFSRHTVASGYGHSIVVDMAGFAEPSPCDGGAWVIDNIVAEGGTRQDINGVPAAITADGTEIGIVSDTGVAVIAYGLNPGALQAFAPVLDALAITAARTVL
jgi:hypothetical protein